MNEMALLNQSMCNCLILFLIQIFAADGFRFDWLIATSRIREEDINERVVCVWILKDI